MNHTAKNIVSKIIENLQTRVSIISKDLKTTAVSHRLQARIQEVSKNSESNVRCFRGNNYCFGFGWQNI